MVKLLNEVPELYLNMYLLASKSGRVEFLTPPRAEVPAFLWHLASLGTDLGSPGIQQVLGQEHLPMSWSPQDVHVLVRDGSETGWQK